MLQLIITNPQSLEVIAIQHFLNWENITYETITDINTVIYLNQGTETPLLMKDEMIVARGFYDTVEHIKYGGVLINE